MANSNPQQEEKEFEVPDHLKIDPEVFDKAAGDTYGGASEILLLDEDEAAGPLTYNGHRLTDLGNGMAPADMHEAVDSEGAVWRLPIATNFRRQAEGANLQHGDTFLMKRLDDVIKKSGKGKGRPMQMYQIKVTNRAPVQQVAAAK